MFVGYSRVNPDAAAVQRVRDEQTRRCYHVDPADDPLLLCSQTLVLLLQQPENNKTNQPQAYDQRSLSYCREADPDLRAGVDSGLTPASGVLAVLLEYVVLLLAVGFLGPQYDVLVSVRVIINHTEERSGLAERAPAIHSNNAFTVAVSAYQKRHH